MLGVMQLLRVVDINFDMMEMVVKVTGGKQIQTQRMEYDKLQRFRIGRQQVKQWFRTKEVKTIEMYFRDRSEPLVIRSSDMKKSFDHIEEYIRTLAAKHELPIEE